jgi:hypothetical protein
MRAARRAAALALILWAAWLCPAGALAKPPVWIVHSRKATLVLFGSIHLLPASLDWRPPALDAALSQADELWFELPINMDSDNEAAAAARARGALPKDRHLTDLLTPDEGERLRRAAAMLNCAPEALDRMQPWMAELTLSVAEDTRSGASAYNGVEDQVQAITPLLARRQAFETARQQIGFLAGAPLKDQLASLSWTLSEITDDPSSYQRVVDEWMDGDIAGLKQDALDPLARISPALYDRLILGRNRRWARTLAARLRRPGAIVVVVGVGHLIGPQGLPAMLRARGLSVDGP